ncbi:hypothetical protein GH714_014647 [Hevea brasiliensis]|uniref:Rx N-terminal domain-containing protein n=1 Tax=Hevea brasiliensis TaxID=3981 RepID=A0A6A6L6K0_HEVBR|nr:hypothetical protein GH714_014647 [Hevea brasiliensis]
MASAAVDHVIGLIVSTVQNEATLSVGINDELDEIRRELVSMKSFLHDAERKQVMSEVMKTWVADVRDIAHQIEDLIDEYMYYVYRQQYFTKLHRIFRTPKTLLETRQIASKLQQINKTIKGMDERRQRYGIDRIEGSNDHYNFPLYQRDLALFMKEDDVVGFVDESRLLKTWLMDKEEHRTLISMTYTRDDLLRSLIKEFHESRKEEVPDDLGTKDFKDLVGILIGYLEQKKYLVVLDDVWDINLWEAIKVSLPNNQFGSRIMLTTRKEDVGSYSSDVRSYILTIKPLKEKEAWDLFCMKAFSSYPDKSCPRELEPLALELVRKCKGLPLAVAALGEDYEIIRKRLIKLWIAEGFVQQVDRTAPKEVAESYLMELIFRSMLQVVSPNEFARPKRCKMHDLLREIGLSISEKEKFGVVYDGKVEIGECESHQARRLSIQTTKGDLQSYGSMTQLRSLFVFVNGSVSFSDKLLSKFKLLELWIWKMPQLIYCQTWGYSIQLKGIEFLTNLQSLVLANSSSSLIGRVNDVESKDRSKDFVDSNGNWWWSKFESYLHPSVLLVMAAIIPLSKDNGEDREYWRDCKKGSFSVKGAYQSLISNDWGEPITGGRWCEASLALSVLDPFCGWCSMEEMRELRVVATVGNYSINVGEAMKKDCVAVSLQVQKEVRWFR